MKKDDAASIVVGIAQNPDREWLAGKPYDDPAAVHRLVQDAAREAGLGARDGQPAFRTIIREGASILVKPNWVLDYNKSGETMDCMVTHPAVISARLVELVGAKPSRITTGTPGPKGCRFERVARANR